ncbi:MAG: 3-isopropylmalate dehydrogenase [Clostridiales bacterium]|nr:3-isopropylmalate dehydrogenase [Clostridiales bacterium]
MKIYKIAVIPGDGIGPEVTSSAVRVLETVGAKCGIEFEFTSCDAGGCAIDKYGKPLPEETLDVCRASDAVLLGAVGGPKWDAVEPSLRPERALLGLRAGLGLYSNLRPALMFKELSSASPLKNVEAIDILIVRELTGGIYFGKHGRSDSAEVLSDGSVKGVTAYDTEEYSVGEITRILREGFRYAQGRNKKLTLVDKANVLESSRLWREIAASLAPEYPDVALDYLYVDNCSMQLINRPSTFDVIVTSNMFGDILSDEAGMITGSIGMLPSASLGAPGTPGMYEPVHGSAPDIAGTGKANPLATILSASMLLRWSLGEVAASDMIEKAVRDTLADGFRTPDIIGDSEGCVAVDTEGMTAAVLQRI